MTVSRFAFVTTPRQTWFTAYQCITSCTIFATFITHCGFTDAAHIDVHTWLAQHCRFTDLTFYKFCRSMARSTLRVCIWQYMTEKKFTYKVQVDDPASFCWHCCLIVKNYVQSSGPNLQLESTYLWQPLHITACLSQTFMPWQWLHVLVPGLSQCSHFPIPCIRE